MIRNVPTAYQAESWDAYTATANTLLNIDPDNIDDVSKSMIDNAVAQREALVQDAPAADCMWYIWGGCTGHSRDGGGLRLYRREL